MQKIAVYWEKTYTVYTVKYVISTNNYIYLSIYLPIHELSIHLCFQITQRFRDYLKDQQFPQFSSASSTFYGTPKFFTLSIRAHYMTLSWAGKTSPRKYITMLSDSFYRTCKWTATFFQVSVPRTLDIIPFTRTRATCTAHFSILVAVQCHLGYPSV